MITVTDDGHCDLNGNTMQLLNQAAIITIRVAELMEGNDIMSKEDAISKINESITINNLIHSGMDQDEALSIVSPDGKMKIATLQEIGEL